MQEDDYLILKKQHDSDIAIEPAKTLKYKILASKLKNYKMKYFNKLSKKWYYITMLKELI